MIEVLAALLVGGGAALVVVALLRRGVDRERELLELLELPYAEDDYDHDEVVGRLGLLRPSAAAMEDVLGRFGVRASLADRLQRARIPLKAGEFVAAVVAVTAASAVLGWLIVGSLLVPVIVVVFLPLLAFARVDGRIANRRKEFEEQLPPALSVMATSLQSGHTMLRAIELMIEESPPPMSEELERVVAETRLGVSVIDALDHLAERLQLRDLEWVVHAVRVQSQTGGKLSDLLLTLADYMRARQDLRREVQVLTAEGRLSAWILSGLPVVVGLYVQVANPEYMSELWTSKGLVVLGLGLILIVMGVVVITRMIRRIDL